MEEEQTNITSRARLLPVEEDGPASSVSVSLPARLKQNLRCKQGWSEVSGSLGDLGTFVPIVVALTLVNGLDLGTTLIFTGIYNILTGLIWGIPMPVQPMKSIAAVAISEGKHLTIPQIMAAGICTAGTLFALGVTGLMGFLYRFLPLPVVRGVQLSQGLSFAFTAVKYVKKNQNFVSSKSEGDRAWVGWDGLILALVSFCFIVLVTGSGDDMQENQVGDDDRGDERDRRRSNRYLRIVSAIPSALIVFLVGIIISICRKPEILKQLTLGPSKLHVVSISRNDWKVGFVRAAIPQIPLSVLNSVIAVCKLSNDLFPLKEVTATSVSASVGVMNLVGCWFGAMPVCHGAGGLAGQYRFGARSGASVVFLGTAKMVLGLLLGSSLVKILTQFPVGLLGVLLLFSGIELAMACRDMNSKQDAFVMLMCTSVSLTGSSAALGFGCGIVLYILLKLRELNYDECIELCRASRRKLPETVA
ncbi:hypothetical protein KI387_034567 [Taxus chinensis]|uniref:Molybdate transporter 1 n=1 Tax=Taxus chinensis TaxID=29808 RepID=A0AA38BWQ7_TAXCH|nr:hypothetical protein KI387_034567 [Taxus chinensis]